MTPTEIKLDKRLQGIFDRLRVVAPLGSQAVTEERAKFLAQGDQFRTAVSQPKNHRHNEWINNFVFAFQRKERIPMLNTLMAIVISVALVFGGTGATVYAAQGSMPDELLYPVKTWSEDARLSLTGSSQEQLAMILDFANRRVAEIAGLQTEGKVIPANVTTRMQNELETALQIAAGMEDPQMIQALEQIRLQAETQSQAMVTIMDNNPELVRLQERLQEQVRLTAAGVSDPQGFRLQVRDRDRLNNPSRTPNPTQPGTHTPLATPQPTGNSYGPGPGNGQSTGTPGHYGPGEPNSSQTPSPTGESYGPGPGNGQTTGTPGHYGPGEPNSSQTPMPTGGGYGPGPRAGTTTCTPENSGGPGNGSNPSQTPQAGDPGSGPQNPTSTTQPGGPGQGDGQSTATPQQNGDPGSGQPTSEPGQGGGGRP
jgi:hypothetical protein